MEQIDKPSPTPTIGYLGAVDDDRQGRLSGWAITRQGDPCEVTATVNGRSFATPSDLPRPDLAKKGQSRGAGGWRIDLAEALAPGENRIDITLPDGTPLSGSPRMVTWTPAPAAVPRHLGAIDSANARLLSGWALTATGDPCEVTITVGDSDPVTVLSEGTRADLAAKGMSRGAGGWHLFLEGRLMPGANRVTIALPDGSAMPGSPLTIEGPPVAPLVQPEAVEPPAPVAVPMPAPTVPAPTVAPAPMSAVVTELPQRQRPTMPSLAELDELSLDDIALAVASGRVQVDAPPPPEPVAPPVIAEPEAEFTPPPRRSWIARLLSR